MTAPRGTPTESQLKGLEYMAVEVSWGSRWINLNDHVKFKVGSQATRDAASKTFRKTIAQSPVLSGSYLIHAVPEMVQQQMSVWVYGSDQTDLADNFFELEELLQQWSFRIRWTFDNYREYWNCQLADLVSSRSQVWTHSLMASVQATIPIYPEIEREALE